MYSVILNSICTGLVLHGEVGHVIVTGIFSDLIPYEFASGFYGLYMLTSEVIAFTFSKQTVEITPHFINPLQINMSENEFT